MLRKIILYNIKEICKSAFVIASTLFSVLSFVLCMMTWEEVERVIKCDKFWLFFAIIVVSVFSAVFWICVFRRKNTIYQNGIRKIRICYGDIINIGFPKLFKEKKKIAVIPVNTSFDTIVDEDIDRIEKPLVSSNTIHGKWLLKMYGSGIDRESLDADIKDHLQGISVVRTLTKSEKDRGKLEHYPFGTVVPIAPDGNTTFLLVALSEFNENNNARSTKESVMKCLEAILDFYVKRGQGYDIFIPLMGTGMSDAGLSHKDSLRILKSFFLLHEESLRGKINIMIYQGNKDQVSIFD